MDRVFIEGSSAEFVGKSGMETRAIVFAVNLGSGSTEGSAPSTFALASPP